MTLTGDNGYRGGTTAAEGTLVAAAKKALGSGVLAVTVRPHGAAPLMAGGDVVIGAGAVLEIAVAKDGPVLQVLEARRV
jgi:autotransporter-associated beta strand protein